LLADDYSPSHSSDESQEFAREQLAVDAPLHWLGAGLQPLTSQGVTYFAVRLLLHFVVELQLCKGLVLMPESLPRGRATPSEPEDWISMGNGTKSALWFCLTSNLFD
jgi:hypothetical protein